MIHVRVSLLLPSSVLRGATLRELLQRFLAFRLSFALPSLLFHPPYARSVDRTMHYLSGIRSESNQPRRRIARARESIPREGNDFRKSQSLRRMCVLASVGGVYVRVAPRVIARNEGPDGKRRTREFPAPVLFDRSLENYKAPSRVAYHNPRE